MSGDGHYAEDPYDEGYDSSDIEFEIPSNPFNNAGADSIKAIVESAFHDRRTTKKAVKTLTFTAATPKTQYLSEMWFRRFNAFREASLLQGGTDSPSGQDIERFFHAILDKIRPRGNGVPSHLWAKSGLRYLIVRLIFEYPDFALSPNERSHIKSQFNKLLLEGKLTHVPMREAQWVGAFFVRLMIAAHYRTAILRGTTNWDKTVQKALSVLLLSALSCRSGDITKDRMDVHELPYLCYDDIVVKLVGGNSIEHLEAKVTIRNEKRKKNNPASNKIVILRAISGEECNIFCPIKLLLVLAMRLGRLEGPIQRVLAEADRRGDKTIQWKEGVGRLPVLCAFENSGELVVVGKPALNDQFRRTVNDMGRCAGILAPITPHDFRRGAARDHANIRKDPSLGQGLADGSVAAELGHSDLALRGGITAKYVGFRNQDSWTKRVNANLQEPFLLETTPNVYMKPSWTRPERLKMYEDAGIDRSDRSAVKRFMKGERKNHEREWMAREKDRTVVRPALLPLSTNTMATPAIFTERISDEQDNITAEIPRPTNTGGASGDMAAQSRKRKKLPSDYGDDIVAFPDGQDPAKGPRGSLGTMTIGSGRHIDIVDDDDGDASGCLHGPVPLDEMADLQTRADPETPRMCIDPCLLACSGESSLMQSTSNDPTDDDDITSEECNHTADRIGEAICPSGDDLSEETEAMVLRVIDAPTDPPKALLRSDAELVDFLSTINVVANQKFGRERTIPSTYGGNGKDEPTFFHYQCSRTPGCQYTAITTVAVIQHEANCSPARVEKEGRRSLFPCPEPGCDAILPNNDSLIKHGRKMHHYKPHRCRVDGCTSDETFADENAYKRHRNTAHPCWTPKLCPIEGCLCNVEFATSGGLRKHLQVQHLITDKDVLRKHTWCKPPGYQPQRCSYPGCTNPTNFSSKHNLIQHLLRVHKLEEDEANNHVSYSYPF